MNKETLENLVEKESQKSSIMSKDIPDLDLYMDQIMTLFEIHLANHKTPYSYLWKWYIFIFTLWSFHRYQASNEPTTSKTHSTDSWRF